MTTIAQVRARLDAARAAGRRVGYVPTMGYLHEGHASLARRARAECDVVGMSIFVNPLQFAPTEDLAAYPRDLARDCALAEGAGVDVVFAPEVAEMYPRPALTTVTVAAVSAPMEGIARPTHFTGVATVVSKLFNIFGAGRAYFGEKDWQQLAVVRRMAADLDVPVEVVGCPTVREPDGLAMSSRNVYLTPQERAAAPVIHRTLTEAAARIGAGEHDPDAIRSLLRERIGAVCDHFDYGEVVDASTLEHLDPLRGELRLLVAAKFGKARLIDNVGAVAR